MILQRKTKEITRTLQSSTTQGPQFDTIQISTRPTSLPTRSPKAIQSNVPASTVTPIRTLRRYSASGAIQQMHKHMQKHKHKHKRKEIRMSQISQFVKKSLEMLCNNS